LGEPGQNGLQRRKFKGGLPAMPPFEGYATSHEKRPADTRKESRATKTFLIMRYLVIFENQPPFYTAFFDAENLFVIGMTVVDILSDKYTVDGVTWLDVKTDHL